MTDTPDNPPPQRSEPPAEATGLTRWNRSPYCDDYLVAEPDGEYYDVTDVDALVRSLEKRLDDAKQLISEQAAEIVKLKDGR